MTTTNKEESDHDVITLDNSPKAVLAKKPHTGPSPLSSVAGSVTAEVRYKAVHDYQTEQSQEAVSNALLGPISDEEEDADPSPKKKGCITKPTLTLQETLSKNL